MIRKYLPYIILFIGAIPLIVAGLTYGEYQGVGKTYDQLVLHMNATSSDSSGNTVSNQDVTAGATGTAVAYVNQGRFNQAGSYITSTTIIGNAGPETFNITSTGVTVSFWMNTTTTLNATQCVINKESFTSPFAGWFVNIDQVTATGTSVAFDFDDTATRNTQRACVAILNDGKWHNIVFTYTNTSTIPAPSSTIRCFIDGAPAQSYIPTLDAGAAQTSITSPQPLRIGQRGNNTLYYKGLLDDVIINFTTGTPPWTPAMIQNYYAQSIGRRNPTLTN